MNKKQKQKKKKIIRLNFNHKREVLVCMMEDCTIEQFSLSTIFGVEEEWNNRIFLLKEGDYLFLDDDNHLLAIEYQTGEKWTWKQLRDEYYKKKEKGT